MNKNKSEFVSNVKPGTYLEVGETVFFVREINSFGQVVVVVLTPRENKIKVVRPKSVNGNR